MIRTTLRTSFHNRHRRAARSLPPPPQRPLADLCAEPDPPSRHSRIRQEHRHLRLTADLRAKATDRRKMAPMDPELSAIVSMCKRHKVRGVVKPLPAAAQPSAWRNRRDAYAAKNYDLCHAAAQKQWLRNRHLQREVVPCVYCIGPKCSRCKGRGEYRTQPDLERHAYAGLLEAIRLFDPSKAHCISSYAVHLMKHQMLLLLRQTPVHYPPDLLRDRRAVAALRKKLDREPTEAEAAAALVENDVPMPEGKGPDVMAKQAKARRRREERLADGNTLERARLALNCYYGNERKSVEDLHERFVQRTERGEDKRRRRSPTAVEALSCSQPDVVMPEDYSEELREVLKRLPAAQRAEVERYLDGRGALPAEALPLLREAML